MPKHYAPDSKSGVSSNTNAFPTNRESKGGLRFGPAPYPERLVRQNVHNTDRLGRVQPKGPRS